MAQTAEYVRVSMRPWLFSSVWWRLMTQEVQLAVKTIPVWQVLRMSMGMETWHIMTDGREKYLASIDVLPAKVRRLRLLVELMLATGYVYDQEVASLRTFFSLPVATMAPQILTALKEAGLKQQGDAFDVAMALFGKGYPIDDTTRSGFFTQTDLKRYVDEFENAMAPFKNSPMDDAERSRVIALTVDRLATGLHSNVPQPPTKIEIALEAMSSRFGTNRELKRAIEAYIVSDPELTAAVADMRAKLADADRMCYVALELAKVMYQSTEDAHTRHARLAQMPVPYQKLLVLQLFYGAVANGGLENFFESTSGAFAEEAAAASREVGALAAAEAVGRGIALYPKPYPVTKTERERYVVTAKLAALLPARSQEEREAQVAVFHDATLKFARDNGLLPQ